MAMPTHTRGHLGQLIDGKQRPGDAHAHAGTSQRSVPSAVTATRCPRTRGDITGVRGDAHSADEDRQSRNANPRKEEP